MWLANKDQWPRAVSFEYRQIPWTVVPDWICFMASFGQGGLSAGPRESFPQSHSLEGSGEGSPSEALWPAIEHGWREKTLSLLCLCLWTLHANEESTLMLGSCGKLACLHSELMPLCLWDAAYWEDVGKRSPQGPWAYPHASVDGSLLASQWFSLASLPSLCLNKD